MAYAPYKCSPMYGTIPEERFAIKREGTVIIRIFLYEFRDRNTRIYFIVGRWMCITGAEHEVVTNCN
jgi:hypothetical protein